jgi:Ser/Thr protein kinase RdoA (MazF antagonist)
VASRDELQEDRLDQAAAHVRRQYQAASGAGPLVPLGNRGGFSGARLWRGEGAAGAFCLRAWPAHATAARVRRLHRLMQHARGQRLDFIPAVFAAGNGDTVVETAERVWELTQWLAGRADFAEHPSAARLEAGCEALARLHLAWEAFTTPAEPCPAVRRRLKVLADWQGLLATGWRPRLSDPCLDPVGPLAERAWRGLPAWLQAVSRSLDPWVDFRRPVQPCLCDLWHDHLLFEGDRLVGLVDYGAVKADQVAVDLSRMLGSLVGDDDQGWERGLRSYRRVRGLDGDQEQLARVLDRTGVFLGMTNWLRWLYHERRPYENLSAIARRLEHLLNRIETWTF